MSLLSARNSKGTHPHPQSLAFLNDTQCAYLKGPLLDTEASLLNLTERFNPLDAEATPGCSLLDSFSNHISFHPCNHSSLNDRNTHLKSLDCLCLEASSSSSTLVVVTNASVIPPRNMQAISATHFWRLGYQVSSSKAPASQTTAPDAELFAIRLGVSKATSMDIECIILINDSLGSARRSVDPSVHSGQAHSLAVCSALRSFFCSGSSHRIEFWDCPSNAEWSLHQIVHNDVTNTRVAAGLHPATSLDALRSKSVLSCLDTWRTAFNHPMVQGHHFLTLRGKNHKPLQPSYSKDGSWLTHIGQLVTLCARATRAILNHASIGEYRQCFSPAECTQCLCGHCQVETRRHIFANCSRFAYSPLIDPSLSIEDFVDFLKEHLSAFAFFSQE